MRAAWQAAAMSKCPLSDCHPARFARQPSVDSLRELLAASMQLLLSAKHGDAPTGLRCALGQAETVDARMAKAMACGWSQPESRGSES
jgi:hypothetical protein